MTAKRTATAALVVAAAVAAVGASGLAATGPGTISITDRQLAYRRLGRGVGAREIVRMSLFQRNTGHRIGQGSLICTFVSSSQRNCSGTYTLPRGTIIASGALSTRLLYELAIVGGTGLYDNARGTLTNTALRLRPRRDLLLFRLTG